MSLDTPPTRDAAPPPATPLVRGALATFASRLFSGGLRYATGIAIARFFGADVYGEFTIGSVLLLGLATLAAGGAVSGLMGAVATSLATGDRAGAGGAIRACRNRSWRFSVPLAAILLAVGHLHPSILGAVGHPGAFVGIALSFPLLSVANVLEAGTRGLRTTRYEILLRCFVQPLLFLGLLLGGRLAGVDVRHVWLVFAISVAVEVLLAEMIVARLFPRSAAPGIAPARLREYLVSEIGSVLAGGIDLWIVGFFVGATRAGHYAAASRTVDVLLVLLGSFQMLLAPSFASLIASRSPGGVEELFGRAGRLMFLLTATLGIPLAVGAEDVLAVFRGQFFEARSALVLMAVVPVMTALWAPSGALLLLRSPALLARARFAGALVTGTGVLLLTPRFGLTGAGAAAAAGALVTSVLIAAAVPERRVVLRLPVVLGAFLILGCGTAAAFAASRLFTGRRLLHCAAEAAACGAATLAVAAVLPGWRRELADGWMIVVGRFGVGKPDPTLP